MNQIWRLAVVACVAFPATLVAQEGNEQHDEEAEEHAVAGSEHGEEQGHKNHFAFVLASTQAELENGEREDPRFTLGIDYERRLNKYVGVGGLLDVIVEGQREAIIGVALFLHAGSLKGVIAPGKERVRETGEWESITRFGVGWEFEVSPALTLTPAVQYDVTKEGGTWVIGLAIGRGF